MGEPIKNLISVFLDSIERENIFADTNEIFVELASQYQKRTGKNFFKEILPIYLRPYPGANGTIVELERGLAGPPEGICFARARKIKTTTQTTYMRWADDDIGGSTNETDPWFVAFIPD